MNTFHSSHGVSCNYERNQCHMSQPTHLVSSREVSTKRKGPKNKLAVLRMVPRTYDFFEIIRPLFTGRHDLVHIPLRPTSPAIGSGFINYGVAATHTHPCKKKKTELSVRYSLKIIKYCTSRRQQIAAAEFEMPGGWICP
jgi:hypothetical protein